MIVEKAVKMANMMQIPILGLVENMSYVSCPDNDICDAVHPVPLEQLDHPLIRRPGKCGVNRQLGEHRKLIGGGDLVDMACIEYHMHHPCPIFMHRFAPSMIF